MNEPEPRKMAIDQGRIGGWLARFDGYRVSVTEARIRAWLKQFDASDRDIGARVLDAVLFVRTQDMEDILRGTVRSLPGWCDREEGRQGKWRFVAFSVGAAESGHTMLHRCRTAMSLSGGQYRSLFVHTADLPSERLGPDDSVVFIDDFAGTGSQACEAWSSTLAELLPDSPKTYLVLVAAGAAGVERIQRETELRVVAGQVLGQEDNVFSPECRHFTGTERSRLLRYCDAADRAKPRGFGDCGFVIVLADKTPNNSIPVLHANHPQWCGLFPRHG